MDNLKEVIPDIVEEAKISFGNKDKESTRLSRIGYTHDSVVVTFWNRSGTEGDTWSYGFMEAKLSERLYTAVVEAGSIGKKFNELFFDGRKPIFKGEKINTD